MFQPARPRGARRFRSTTPASPTGFNPRAREGRDEVGEPAQLHQREVSTRAPARGATPESRRDVDHRAFQPARPRGARRPETVTAASSMFLFQPARPRGARQLRTRRRRRGSSFNPRAREGRDAGGKHRQRPRTVQFQPARPRGARLVFGAPIRLDEQVSTRAPARGATPSPPSWQPSSRRCFNPRAREGRDQNKAQLIWVALSFQPARPRGARLIQTGS